MATLTGQEVWEATLNDASFAKQMPEGPLRDAIRPFVEKSPEILAAYLEKKVTLESFVQAKAAFIEYCLENGFADIMASAAGMDSGFIKDLLGYAHKMFSELLKDVVKFLEEHGITEDQVILSAKAGLNETNRELYKKEQLTIHELLRTQPGVILRNDV